MTNPPSQPGSETSLPTDSLPDDAAASPAAPAATPARKAPRRASSPAGTPQRASAPALLVLDAAGMIVPTKVSPLSQTDDAGTAPLPEPAPAAEFKAGDEVAGGADAVIKDAQVQDSGDTNSGDTDSGFKGSGPFAPEPVTETEPDTATAAATATATATAKTDADSAPTSASADADTPTPDADADADAKDLSGSEVEPEALADDAPEEPSEDAASADTAPVAEDLPVPQSRRERRLAEGNTGDVVGPAGPTTAAGSIASGSSPTTSLAGRTPSTIGAGTPGSPDVAKSTDATPSPSTLSQKSKPKRKRKRVVGALRGFLFLIVIAAIVVGMGTVLSEKNDPTTGPTLTETHRQAAWAQTSALVENVAAVEATGGQPKLTRQLQDTATDLAAQLAALSDGLPLATADSSATASAGAPADLRQLVAGLQTNGAELLDNAVSADHAMGRVFAAVGTSQLLRGRALSEAAGLAPAGTPWLPATINFASPSGPECSSTLAPRPGPTVDGALRSAAEGEQKAVYAYEAATTRLPAAEFSQGEELLAGHQDKLALLNAELQVRCLPTVVLVPGFALAPEFTSAPEAALATLEAELATSYADLAALSTAPIATGATGTTGTTGSSDPASSSAATSTTESSPISSHGTSAGTSTATHANTSLVRQMSVTWLLDSTRSHLMWGGSLEPLPGITAEPAPATP